jgi:very-short-patch-repair endonuclease
LGEDRWGLRVIRFGNDEIVRNLSAVMEGINEFIDV